MIVYGNVAGIIHRELQPLHDGARRPSLRTWRNKRVLLDGTAVFDSVKDCALAIGCHPGTLSTALREGRRCRGHEVAYAEER